MKKYVVEYVEIENKIEGKLTQKKVIFYNRIDYIDYVEELKNGVPGKVLTRHYMTQK